MPDPDPDPTAWNYFKLLLCKKKKKKILFYIFLWLICGKIAMVTGEYVDEVSGLIESKNVLFYINHDF